MRKPKRDIPVRVTRYEVNAWPGPEDHPNGRNYRVTIEDRGDDLWAVCHGPMCLDVRGRWSFEPKITDRPDGWRATHRFPLGEALRRAKRAAVRVQAQGMTADECWEWTQARMAEVSA